MKKPEDRGGADLGAAPSTEKNNKSRTSSYTPEPHFRKKNQSELEQDCLPFMNEHQFPIKEIICDGSWQRLSIDGGRDEDEWYRASVGISTKDNLWLMCSFGTFAGGHQTFGTYKSWESDLELSIKDKKDIEKKFAEWEKQNKQYLIEEEKKRIQKAHDIWERASKEPSNQKEHLSYLNRKMIKNYGARFSYASFNDGTKKNPKWDKYPTLVIPLRNSQSELQGIQHIRADGEKRIYGLKEGNFFVLGTIDINSHIYLSEGYSTGASCHEAKGYPTVIAFDCGNLDPVLANLRKIYPKNPITILGDDDVERKENPGRTHAEAAAKKHRCNVAFATFPSNFTLPPNKNSEIKRPTDWNDLHVHLGIEAVREQLDSVEKGQKTPLPANFEFQHGYLVFQPPAKDDDKGMPPAVKICSKLEVTALVRNEYQKNHSRLLEFSDPDGHQHKWPMPMELLAGSGEELRRYLLSEGLLIESGKAARNLLIKYIQECSPKERARCVLKTGWYRDCFIFPDEIIGSCGQESVILQSSEPSSDYSVRGTMEDWRLSIAALCKNNSRLIFSASSAFAAPLLELLGMEGGGFNLKGSSSIGKSTAQRVAGSIWGPPSFKKTWRTTDNGLEALCTCRNHSLLLLDELSQCDPEKAGQAAYLITNGRGKGRMDSHIALRKESSWNLLLLSSGEMSLSSHIELSGRKSRAGQEVRIVDIPADTGKYGLFEDLHGRANGQILSDYLTEKISVMYGTPSREFIKRLVQEKSTLIPLVQQSMKEFVKTILPKGIVSGQVRRVADRFALVAIAGELATQFEITGWVKGDAEWAASQCFHAWLKERGGSGDREETTIIEQIRLFFSMHGSSRFCHVNHINEEIKTINQAGYRRPDNKDKDDDEFLLIPEVFRAEVARGLDPSTVIKVCIEKGLLLPDKGSGEPTTPIRLPKKKTRRFYVFTSLVLGEDK